MKFVDVFLVCSDGRGGKTYQIWVNRKDDGFVLSQQGALPTGTQAISFADIGMFIYRPKFSFSQLESIDRDGTINLIFPTCSSVSRSGVGSDCYINIAYNQQLPLCTSTTESGIKKGTRVCRRPEDLCVADPNFKFNLSDSPTNDVRLRPLSSVKYSLSSSVCRRSFGSLYPRFSRRRLHYLSKTRHLIPHYLSPSSSVMRIWTAFQTYSLSLSRGRTTSQTSSSRFRALKVFLVVCKAVPAAGAGLSRIQV